MAPAPLTAVQREELEAEATAKVHALVAAALERAKERGAAVRERRHARESARAAAEAALYGGANSDDSKEQAVQEGDKVVANVGADDSDPGRRPADVTDASNFSHAVL